MIYYKKHLYVTSLVKQDFCQLQHTYSGLNCKLILVVHILLNSPH